MGNWAYKIPTLNDAPQGLFSWDSSKPLISEEMDMPRIGVYCEESSHEGNPWFIASFVLNWKFHEQTGEIRWTVSDKYRTGTGHLLQLANIEMQLLTGDELKPVVEMTDDERATARGRWAFECKTCGLRQTFRNETFQRAALALWQAGIREISLTGLQFAVKRFAK